VSVAIHECEDLILTEIGKTVMPAQAGGVIPVEAGIQRIGTSWIPAFAGMTNNYFIKIV